MPHRISRIPFIPIGPSIAYIPLTQNQYALIDDVDIPLLPKTCWMFQKTSSGGRAVCKGPDGNLIMMHNLICPREEGVENDHRNRRGTDNRRSNLRPATRSQNMMNRKSKRSEEGMRGIQERPNGKFTVTIAVGTYGTKEEARLAMRKAQTALHGEFACLD